MRLQTTLLAAVAATFAAGFGASSAQAATVEIEDAVARVTVVPENRSDIKIEVISPNAKLPLTVRTAGDRTILDGDLDRRIRSCRSTGERSQVHVRGVGDIGWAQMPQVVIRTPRDVKVEADGAVFGSVGRSASLELGNSGCGDWTIANVEGAARVSQAGSGDTRMGSSGSLKVRVAGSGDVATADVRGGLDINIAGSGSASVRSVNGPLEVSIAGSGDVDIGSGRATAMKVSVAGSGDVEFGGTADSLRARIAGSGDVHAHEVKGEISKSIMGSGSVRVGG
ncbi:GIN domain-containing protein [Phenylobacterium sp.]|uniref:GIN domain-containing protein n=1 Tax=Phenylobacterium sp. TaxID=1871053 RepID=UPI002ED934C1